MTWYKVTLSDEDISAMRQFELQNAFAVILADHDAPKDAGMFEGKSIGSHDYYFSPGDHGVLTFADVFGRRLKELLRCIPFPTTNGRRCPVLPCR